MKIGLKAFSLILLVALVAIVLHIVISTGYFRKIEPYVNGRVIKKIDIPGAEDITISYADGFALISSDDRIARRDGNARQGGIYYLDLKKEQLNPELISMDFEKPFYPHGISIFQVDSLQYKVMAINHVEGVHSIEAFLLYGDSLVYQETIKHTSMISPNDVVMVDENRFYFTNDHGYTSPIGIVLEEYLGLSVSNVVFFDGQNYREVADGIAYANGINYDPDRSLLFVASVRGFEIKVYKVDPGYGLQHLTDIDAGTGVDNIEIDRQGRLWSGAHPSLLAFTAYFSGRKPRAPSEVVRIDFKGESDYNVEQFLMDDGNIISGASVAAIYQDLLLVGNVADDHFIILRLED